jgi:thiol-disulfide isomerase/thioredoxin
MPERKRHFMSLVAAARSFVLACLVVLATSAAAEGFTLKDTQGRVHRLADYKGRWVLVNFWATWCPPCLEEIPDLISLHEKFNRNKLVVIGVAMEYRDPKAVTAFAESLMVSYPIVLGNPKIAAQIGPVDGLPTTYLFNPEGKLVAYNVGALTAKAVEKYIAMNASAEK